MKGILSTALVLVVLVLLLSAMPWAAASRGVSVQESLAEDLKALSLFNGISETLCDRSDADARTYLTFLLRAPASQGAGFRIVPSPLRGSARSPTRRLFSFG